MKLHNILVTPMVMKNATTDHDSSKVPALNYIPAVLLKNYKPELSCILTNLFNICLKKS